MVQLNKLVLKYYPKSKDSINLTIAISKGPEFLLV